MAKFGKFIACQNGAAKDNKQRAIRLAALTRAGRFTTRIANGAGLARYVRRAGAAAWSDEKANNRKLMQQERQQTAYSYVHTVRTDD